MSGIVFEDNCTAEFCTSHRALTLEEMHRKKGIFFLVFLALLQILNGSGGTVEHRLF